MGLVFKITKPGELGVPSIPSQDWLSAALGFHLTSTIPVHIIQARAYKLVERSRWYTLHNIQPVSEHIGKINIVKVYKKRMTYIYIYMHN